MLHLRGTKPTEGREGLPDVRQNIEQIRAEVIDRLIPEGDRNSFSNNALRRLEKTRVLKTEEDWVRFRGALERIPEEYRWDYTKHSIPKMVRRGGFSWDRLDGQLVNIRGYTERFGELDFIWDVAYYNLGGIWPADSVGHPLNFPKLPDVKYMSRLQPLDGRLAGVIFRTLEGRCYRAWVEALESGIPCEPILKYPEGHPKAGEYRAKRLRHGRRMVACLYCGPDIPEFLKNPENGRYREEVFRQMEVIRARLRERNIRHGHLHDMNFTVSMDGGKPVVRVIDFDEAEIIPPLIGLRDMWGNLKAAFRGR